MSEPTLSEIHGDMVAHESQDNVRFAQVSSDTSSIKQSINKIEMNHLVHMQDALTRMSVDIKWMKWMLLPIAIPVVEAVAKILRRYT